MSLTTSELMNEQAQQSVELYFNVDDDFTVSCWSQG
jgi:hypothetical protein